MKILIAVDGSDFSKRMLAWLAVHDELLSRQADHTFVTVVHKLSAHVARHLEAGTQRSYYDDRAREVLEPVTAFARQKGWRFDTHVAVGHPAEAIAECAATGGHDLLVMGSHGHSAAGSLLLGSVTQRVLALSKIPVLIVR